MEVIAKRKDSLLFLYGGITALGAIILLIALIKPFNLQIQKTSTLVAGLVLFFVGSFICANILRMPKEIICFDGENLILPQGKYPLKQLSNVNYRHARIKGVNYRWGRIILTINGQKFEYINVADVESVHNRIMQLRLEAEKLQ